LLLDGEIAAIRTQAILGVRAAIDRSPIVRLSIASSLQRLPVADRWSIARNLLWHAEDAGDANIPLMIWYGIEPFVATDPSLALKMATEAKIPLIREFISRRAVEHAVLQKENGDLSPLTKALLAASPEVQTDLLNGARAGLSGRKSMKMPADWPKIYAKLSASTDKATRENVKVLALIFGDPQALADLRKTALETTASEAERSAALQALVDKRVDDVPLLALIDDPAVRRTTLKGLAAIPNADAPKRILAIYAKLTPDEKQDAVATLASRAEYALALLEAVEKGTVPRGDISAYAARQIDSLNDKQVSERLKSVWGAVRQSGPQRIEQLAKWKKTLTPAYLKSANLANGRLIYNKSCAACHKLYGEGGAIGPDITGSNRSDLDYLLSNLVDPSSEVSKDYRMSAVETSSGRKITGIIVEKTAARLVIQTATERVVIPAEDMESVTDSDVSIMPEGQLDALTKEQARDLIGYLSTKTPPPLPKP
jgi:putative heme-binding domain-containing protein